MDGTGKILNVLSIRVIVEINRLFIETSGEEFIGEDNLLYCASLQYILDAIQQSLFGVDLFPDLFAKAAIAERIIVNHVFFGANKRTGLLACATFLAQNGFVMEIFDGERFDQEAIETALHLQEKEMEFDAFAAWVRGRSIPMLNITPNA